MAIKRAATDSDMGKRWTPNLMSDGFTPISNAFLEHYAQIGITSPEAMLLIHLISYKWDEKHPYPKFSRLAAKMKISETAVRAHARHLEEKQLLRRVKRPGTTNQFDLAPLFRKLEEVHKKAQLDQSLRDDLEADE